MSNQRSTALFDRARRVIPGGVNSPVRAFRGVGGTPPFMASGEGPWIVDVDGNQYLDYVCSWGPLILGHAHPAVVTAATEALQRGSSFGTPTEAEVELAEEIVERVPAIDMVRAVSSGTEAIMSAIRLARGVTGRKKIVKFSGHYHGHADALLVSAGSGVATLGLPDSPGVTTGATADTLVVAWNDRAGVEDAFTRYAQDIAAVVCEPVAANMGVVPADDGFLAFLRRITTAHGSLLLFDEVLTGFRVARGGAGEHYGIVCDLVALGKVVGGGFPLAAVGGRADVMQELAPAGPVYQAGTLSGNPVAVAAGLTQLRLLETDSYRHLKGLTDRLLDGLVTIFADAGIDVALQRVTSLCSIFFRTAPVRTYADAQASDHARYARFFHGMLERGHYLPPSGFEALFVSMAHTASDIDRTLAAAHEVAAELVEPAGVVN